jgi:hypothetical protein
MFEFLTAVSMKTAGMTEDWYEFTKVSEICTASIMDTKLTSDILVSQEAKRGVS